MQTKECNQLFGTSYCGAADAAVGGGLIAPFVGLSGSRICPTGSDLTVERKFLKDSYCIAQHNKTRYYYYWLLLSIPLLARLYDILMMTKNEK